MVCCVSAPGSVTSLTANGTVSVVEAGAVGASAKVTGVPSTEITSELPNDPVHEAGMLTTMLPVIRSRSFAAWVQETPVTLHHYKVYMWLDLIPTVDNGNCPGIGGQLLGHATITEP